MKLRRHIQSAIVAVLFGVGPLTTLSSARAQDCEGDKPRGGKWVASGELYLDRARRNTKPEDRMRNFRDAVNILEEGFVEQPDNPRNYLMAGDAYVGIGDYTAADSAWTRAAAMWSCYGGAVDSARYTAWVQAYNRGARYSNDANDMERALKQFRDAWTVYKKLPQPQISIGNYYAQQAAVAETPEAQAEARAKAIESFRLALEAIERSTRLQAANRSEYHRTTTFNLAQLLAFEERYDEAVAAYDEFLAAEPDNVTAKSNAAVTATLAADQYADRADETEDAEQKEALLAKADEYTQIAQTHYADLLSRDDLEADEYHNIGAGLSRLDQNDEALAAFKKALELEPYRASTLERIALTYYAMQAYDTLVSIAGQLVERYPLSMNNLAILANAYRELERSEDALAILERRESLELELLNLELSAEEGVYTVRGYLHNISLAPGSEVGLEFSFYDDVGELAASAAVTVTAPEQGTQGAFEVSAESSSLISGFTYKRTEPGAGAEGGS